MKENWLTVALPKGKLGEEALALTNDTGLPTNDIKLDSRKLLWEFPDQRIRFIISRPTDIPVYVDYGAADMGIVGKDTLVEAGANVFELVDLRFGGCKFVVAVPEEKLDAQGNFDLSSLNHGRVASKFPNVAQQYFHRQGLQVEVIKLHGNIELAPRVGLADAIVDIVSTGRTLKENQLAAVGDIFYATARLIANRVSYRMQYQRVKDIMEELRRVLEKRGVVND
ncbi:ATP phosphoribosyltransferase [Metallumcola ferriviriculae]|uniref:ATP phosphoribosyltransferase n=1 Tax=Metallumcola ferriviriculae TaxID=3039180 RepID=A0AAU0USP8_9FIRM|nr:ATP phosphoribosyltransferase [Desulfitibacteraceae bacterium MK1]